MRCFLLALATLFTFTASAQTAYLSMLADPTDNSGARFVKISNSSGSDLDLTGGYLQRWTNGNTEPQSSVVDLGTYGTLYDTGCIYVAANGDAFTAAYGFAPDIVALIFFQTVLITLNNFNRRIKI